MNIDNLKRSELITKILLFIYLIITILLLVSMIVFIKNIVINIILFVLIIVNGIIIYKYYEKNRRDKEKYLLFKSVKDIDNNCNIVDDRSFPLPLKINFSNFNDRTVSLTKIKASNFTLMETATIIEAGMPMNDSCYTYTYDFTLDKEYDKTIISYKNNYYIKDRNNKISSGNQDFDTWFDIYSSTNISNELMTLLRHIKEYIFTDFVIYIEKNKLYIFIFSRMDYLRIIKSGKLDDLDRAQHKFSKEIELIMKIYECIK